MTYNKRKQLHFEVTTLGLRAQATAVGLVQLCIELRRAKMLDEPAIERIKNAIADDVSVTAPRALASQNYRTEIMTRLDRLFAGDQEVGPADGLSFGATPDSISEV
jgi:hypothetical protein